MEIHESGSTSVRHGDHGHGGHKGPPAARYTVVNAWLTGAAMALMFAFVIAPTAISALFPMTFFYELRSVTIDDAPSGQPPHIVVDRTINRVFTGRFDNVIMREQGSEFVAYWSCGTHGSDWRQYRPDAALPIGADMDWWLDIPPNRECHLPPGRYKLVTTIFAKAWFGAEVSTERSSNVFTVGKADP